MRLFSFYTQTSDVGETHIFVLVLYKSCGVTAKILLMLHQFFFMINLQSMFAADIQLRCRCLSFPQAISKHTAFIFSPLLFHQSPLTQPRRSHCNVQASYLGRQMRNEREGRFLYSSGRKHLLRSDPSTTCS
jgi:hypothetical protein